ncbi:hypothetical protein EBT25_00980 [bacterium]|jgi:hypothetical protein|nr:hypothetical protein [bacterium]
MSDHARYVDYTYDQDAILKLIAPLNLGGKVPISAFNDSTRRSIKSILKWSGEFIGVTDPLITVAYLAAGQKANIHIDADQNGNLTLQALNLPITKCNQVFMNWYKLKEGSEEINLTSARGHKLRGLKREDAECVFTFECNKPAVVNPTTFHDIENKSSEPHLIISVRG